MRAISRVIERLWKLSNHLSQLQWLVQVFVPAGTTTIVITTIFNALGHPPGWKLAVVMALAGLLSMAVCLFGILLWRDWRRSRSPIHVLADIHTDMDHVQNERGERVEGAYSVAICLCIENGHRDGKVLRNIQARFYSLGGQSFVLPIRDADRGGIDLRDGEYALIEVGRMFWKLSSGESSLPSYPRTGLKLQTMPQERIDDVAAPAVEWRQLYISDFEGISHQGIGQTANYASGVPIRIVIAADDVVSRFVYIETDLFADKARDWLKIAEND